MTEAPDINYLGPGHNINATSVKTGCHFLPPSISFRFVYPKIIDSCFVFKCLTVKYHNIVPPPFNINKRNFRRYLLDRVVHVQVFFKNFATLPYEQTEVSGICTKDTGR